MKCQSCNVAEIPPEWVHCIKSNICPGCGGSILTDDIKELMDELAMAMEKMPNNPQGVAGWLIDNYHFRKIGLAQPVEKFYTKSAGQENKVNRVNGAPEFDSKFMNRTGMSKTIQETANKFGGGKSEKLMIMAQELEKLSSEDIDVEENDDAVATTAEERAWQKSFSNTRSNRHSESNLLLDPNVGEVSEDDYEAIANMGFGEPGGVSESAKERYIEQERLNRLKKQIGGGGIFKRKDS